MAIQPGIERYIPKEGVALPDDRVIKTALFIRDQNVPHFATADFPSFDPWSRFMREEIALVRKEGGFRGRSITEFGIGDGRNIKHAADHPKDVLGVDIEQWRLEVAGVNLANEPIKIKSPVELWRADAVDLLKNLKYTGRNSLSGWVIMCLPQSPEGLNAADKYNGSSTLDSYRADWDQSGLTLNAATLDCLREVATKDLRVLVILSDRVPSQLREEMIKRMGWKIQRQFQTREPIQQDPDTGISWTSKIDDGGRFFEMKQSVLDYEPISATEAERRRVVSLVTGDGRMSLNVYHHLTVYQLKPNGIE